MPRRRRPRRSGALTEFPPAKLLGQIALLQALLYATAAPLLLFTALVSGGGFSLDQVFGWRAVRGDTTQGWVMALVWVLAGGFSALYIVLFVGRSKLVLDFALTLHALHLVVVILFTGALPTNLAWWAAMAMSAAVAVTTGTWGCQHRELRPIHFGGSAAAATASSAGAAGAASAALAADTAATLDAPGDEEQGFVRGGGGRGRARDRGGAYEMVSMPSEENSRQD